MARRKKSYQKGSIKKVVTNRGIVYRIRYRKRKPEGGWAEFTETLQNCPDKKTALKVLDERLRKINGSNGGIAQEFKTMSDLLCTVWPNYLTIQRVKGSTRASWDTIVKKWISPYFGDRILDEIEPVDVGSFISYLNSKGLSSKYQVNIYGVLRLMFDVAQLNGYMALNPIHPKIHRPLVDREKKHTWAVDQAKLLLSVVDSKYRAPLMVLALTGIRVGELLALRWINVDFFRKRIMLAHSLWRGQLVTTKTKASDREIGMSNQLMQVLLAHRNNSIFNEPENFVFCQADGRPISPDSLRRQGIYPALKAVGIPYVKRASGCHAFRHLVGSVINKATGSLKMAQEQLGHANIATTGDIYIHTDDEQVDRSAEILGDTFGETCGKSVVNAEIEKGSIQ